MEGLLQSLKFSDAVEQRRVCGLAGRDARKMGSTVEWRENWMLYWDGEPIARDSKAYQALLDEAYLALFSQNRRAATALVATGDAVLTHSIGSHDSTDTILTAQEFCERLTGIRSNLVGGVGGAPRSGPSASDRRRFGS